MLEALKFVSRAVAKRDTLPTLTHFAIRRQRVTAFNGTLAISAPLNVSFDAAPLAVPFVRALDACESVISIAKESTARLLVRSGNFKSFIPCVDVKNIPQIEPEGTRIPATELVAAFRILKPFICTDELRPQLRGVLLHGDSACATNNVILVEYWLGTRFPFFISVPVAMVDELLRVEDEPEAIQVSANSITAHYADGRWIRSQLNALNWPDVHRTLEMTWRDSKLEPIPQELKTACAKLLTFTGRSNGAIFFRGVDVATAKTDDSSGVAIVEVPSPPHGCYNASYLNAVLAIADKADFMRSPLPVPFVGERIRGALCGRRE